MRERGSCEVYSDGPGTVTSPRQYYPWYISARGFDYMQISLLWTRMGYHEVGRPSSESAFNCKESVTDVTFRAEAPTQQTSLLCCRSLADWLHQFEHRHLCEIALQ